MPVDEERLLQFLADRSRTRQPVVGAIYDGLADRVRRGDFAPETTDRSTR